MHLEPSGVDGAEGCERDESSKVQDKGVAIGAVAARGGSARGEGGVVLNFLRGDVAKDEDDDAGAHLGDGRVSVVHAVVRLEASAEEAHLLGVQQLAADARDATHGTRCGGVGELMEATRAMTAAAFAEDASPEPAESARPEAPAPRAREAPEHDGRRPPEPTLGSARSVDDGTTLEGRAGVGAPRSSRVAIASSGGVSSALQLGGVCGRGAPRCAARPPTTNRRV